MKKSNGIIGSLLFLLIVSCTPDEEVNSNISTTLQEGSWRISYFEDSTENETQNFAGYGFAFGSDQTITAIKDSITINGEWYTGDDNDLTNLVIDFSDIIDFKDLNADWDAFEVTDADVNLRCQGIPGTNYLTFTKNE